MAKLARNRGMFFASWTGKEVTETATANHDSAKISKLEITAATFGTAVNKLAGEYEFVYKTSDTDSYWDYKGTKITTTNLGTEYGISVTGTPDVGDMIVVAYTPASGGWEALGKDNDDLAKELNPDTETTKNVLGETTFKHSGYETELSLDPYYIDPSRMMYAHLLDISLREVYAETDCGGYFAEAFFTTANAQKQTMTGYCYVRSAWFVPQSVGGDTSGYAIPINVIPTGPMTRKKIVYDMTTNVATITDEE